MEHMIIKIDFLTGIRILKEGVSAGVATARMFPPGDSTRQYSIQRARACARALRDQFGRDEATRILRNHFHHTRAYERPIA